MNQQRQEGLTPLAQLLVQHVIHQEHIRAASQIFRVLRQHEFADKGNHTNTAPSTTIHGGHRRQLVTHHKELAHNDELLLVAIEGAGLHHVLTRELLHPRRVNGLLVIRLLEIDEPPALGRHDFRVRRTRLRTLTRQHRGLERGLVITQGQPHQLNQLGLSIAADTSSDIEALLAIHTLQTGRQKPEGVAAEFRTWEQL